MTSDIKNVTLYPLLKTIADEWPDAVAMAAPGRRPLTYGGLVRFLESVTKQLNAMKIGRNDRVCVVLPNGPEMAVAFTGIAAGCTCAPLNPKYTADDFEFYLTDLKAKAVIVHHQLDSPVRDVAGTLDMPVIELIPETDGESGLFRLEGGRTSPADQSGFARADDIALVLHTSGTTSRPKIVPLSQANVCHSARHIRNTLRLTPDDRCLNVMPLFHIHGLMGATLSSLSAGASIVCTPGFDADCFFDWMKEMRPTWYSAVPTMHQSVLVQAPANREIIQNHPLRFIRSSSASLPKAVMAELESVFKAPVIESYGMTEASHQMASNPLPPEKRIPGSVGKAAGPEVAIMNQSGHLLQTGKKGEIVIRGSNVTRGYENNPGANEHAFTNGWFRTGDEGYLDADGYLFITGRIKEMINRGGEKIAPLEIDEILLRHPDIRQVVTFALPHATLGEDVAAAVVLHENADVTEKAIREFAFENLTEFKVPSRIVFLDTIPKGPTGKLQRIGLANKLRDHLQAVYTEPGNVVEKALSDIWSEVLRLDRVGIHDNFFSLGGNSLLATQVVNRIHSSFLVDLPLRTIFVGPTIAEQALVVGDIILREIDEKSGS